MKILVVSDTHRKHENLKRVLELEQPIDRMIHLGDAEGCEEEIEEMVNCPLDIVAGNSDFFSSLEQEQIIEIGNERALITHGHYYNVNAETEDIKKEAEGRDCRFVMFGHTHRPIIDEDKDKGVTAMNPGSLSYPRQEGREPSYIVMELSDDGKISAEIRFLPV